MKERPEELVHALTQILYEDDVEKIHEIARAVLIERQARFAEASEEKKPA